MIDRLRFYCNVAAMSVATQLNALSQSFAEEPSALPPEGAPSTVAVPEAPGLIEREVRFGVVPDLARRLMTIANQTPVAALSADEAVSRWERLGVSAEELWVDIGSGNGETLGKLARRNKGRFIGVDLENSLPLILEQHRGDFLNALPANARYLTLSWNRHGRGPVSHPRLEQIPMIEKWGSQPSSADMIAAATVDSVGAASASVVSLIFPYTESRKRTAFGRVVAGPAPQVLDIQLRTAIELLRPSGWGVAVLEAGPTADQKRVLGRTLDFLRSRREIAWVGGTPHGMSVERLNVSPYAPKNDRGEAVDTEALRHARVVFFQKKA